MAKQKAAPRETKKHIARAERERQQRLLLIISMVVVAVVVILLVAVGIYDTYFVQPYQPVAVVNGEEIPSGLFETRVRWAQRTLVAQLGSQIELLNAFVDQPELTQTLEGQIIELQAQLSEPALLAQDVFDQLTVEAIFRQEADRQGITVNEEEIDLAIQELFDFYPEGTPTPQVTAAPTITVESSPSSTQDPLPEPTIYSREAFDDDYKVFVNSLRDFRIAESDFRDLVRNQLIQAKVQEAFEAETEFPTTEEQVLVRHIFVEEEETALEVLQLLDDGGSFEDLVLEYSEDSSTVETGGEIGWMRVDDLQTQFGIQGLIIFDTPLGEVTGPVESPAGFHLVLVVAREDQPLSDFALQQIQFDLYAEWVQSLRGEAEIEIFEGWEDYLPPPFAPAAG